MTNVTAFSPPSMSPLIPASPLSRSHVQSPSSPLPTPPPLIALSVSSISPSPRSCLPPPSTQKGGTNRCACTPSILFVYVSALSRVCELARCRHNTRLSLCIRRAAAAGSTRCSVSVFTPLSPYHSTSVFRKPCTLLPQHTRCSFFCDGAAIVLKKGGHGPRATHPATSVCLLFSPPARR